MFQAYLITCRVSGRQYIGITSRGLHRRWAEHVYDATRRQTALARAISRYGRAQFTIEAVCSFATWEDALATEATLIVQHCTNAPHGYNIRQGGEGAPPGLERSAESVERSAAKHRGRPCHPNTRLAARLAHSGRPKSPEHRAKIAAARLGKGRSPETKAKIAAYWAARRAAGEFKTERPYAHH